MVHQLTYQIQPPLSLSSLGATGPEWLAEAQATVQAQHLQNALEAHRAAIAERHPDLADRPDVGAEFIKHINSTPSTWGETDLRQTQDASAERYRQAHKLPAHDRPLNSTEARVLGAMARATGLPLGELVKKVRKRD